MYIYTYIYVYEYMCVCIAVFLYESKIKYDIIYTVYICIYTYTCSFIYIYIYVFNPTDYFNLIVNVCIRDMSLLFRHSKSFKVSTIVINASTDHLFLNVFNFVTLHNQLVCVGVS